MKSYCQEKLGEKVIDWNRFLSQPLGDSDWKLAEKHAGEWVTCACGNQCSVIPRDNCGVPRDDLLRRLGNTFFIAICWHNKHEAKKILEQIEIRSKHLIDEINNHEKRN